MEHIADSSIKLLEKFNISPIEMEFIKQSSDDLGHESNHARIISDFYLAKTIEQSTDKILNSNLELKKDNDKHYRIFKGLTWVLAFAVFIYLIGLLVQVFELLLFLWQ